MATRLLAGQLKNMDSIPGRGNRFFSSSEHPNWLLDPFILPFNVNKVFFSVWVNELGCESDLSCPSNAEVMN